MTAVSPSEFRAHLVAFHRVYQDKVREWVPPECHDALLRNHYLQGSDIVGYVSTTYGIGYAYCPEGTGDLRVVSGDRRVEAHFFGCPSNALWENARVAVRLSGPNFRMVNARFTGLFPLRLDGSEASATLVELTWSLQGRTRRLAYAEMFATRAARYWSAETAIQRAMDEVLQATVAATNMQTLRMSLSDYLERFKQGHVLLLGDYSEAGTQRLNRIREALAALGYYGFTLEDVKEVPEYDLRQKLTAIAPVCRFVLVDDSSRSGHTAELPIIDGLRVVAVVLRHGQSRPTFVTRGLDTTSKVIKEYEYNDTDLETVLCHAVAWAESTMKALQCSLSRIYPWRATSS
jgi:hypothetical protein